MNDFLWLQEWYAGLCDGDWEHEYGIAIETLDNPGWSVIIHLNDTIYEDMPFEPVEENVSESDWLFLKIEAGTFFGVGDENKLLTIVSRFRSMIQDFEDSNG